jgi:hypothetical protein
VCTLIPVTHRLSSLLKFCLFFFFFSAKVAVQIVDYYNLAANTLELISSDECSVSEILGAKIYKVRAHVTTAQM